MTPKEYKDAIMKHVKEITKMCAALPKVYGTQGFHLTLDVVVHDNEIKGGINASPFNVDKHGEVLYRETDDDGYLLEEGDGKRPVTPEILDAGKPSPEKVVDDLLKKLLGGGK